MNSVTFGEKPSDKEELDGVMKKVSETPRTDAVRIKSNRCSLGVEVVPVEDCEQLETELSESKANHRKLAEASIRIHAKLEAELAEANAKNAELKRQIAEFKVWLNGRRSSPEWTTIGMIEERIKQFAAEQAGKAGGR